MSRRAKQVGENRARSEGGRAFGTTTPWHNNPTMLWISGALNNVAQQLDGISIMRIVRKPGSANQKRGYKPRLEWPDTK
jgi:hypothetical protein